MSTVVYDSILGKLREAEISGGTGGGGGVQTKVLGGYRISVSSSGSSATVDQDKWFPITSVTGATVTMQPGEAYKIQATTSAVTLNTTEIPANQFGLESHLEIFVANTGYVVTGSNVVLANALEPDAVNNCTVRFHDGFAIISVEDHVAGYIVTVNAASGAGSLNYGLSTASNEYISIDASLNGHILDLGGAVTSAGEKHVVGNGYTDTVISGGITCTSKTTFSDLSLENVVNSGGTMTLGDVAIPSGATVTVVSGGNLAVENVHGEGGTLDLNATVIINPNGGMSGLTVSGGSGSNAGAFQMNGGLFTAESCTFTGNTSPLHGGVAMIYGTASASFISCSLDGNTNGQYNPGTVYVVGSSAAVHLEGCTFGANQTVIVNSSGTVTLAGSNAIRQVGSYGVGGSVVIADGATVDITSAGVANAVAPGIGVTFGGEATILYTSGGSAVSGSILAPNYNYKSITSDGIITTTGNILMPSNLTGLTIQTDQSFTPSLDGSTVLTNATLSGTLLAYGADTGSNGNVTISGHCRFTVPFAYKTNGNFTCLIKPGAIIDFTGGQSSYFSQFLIATPTASGITVEGNATVILVNGTSVSLPAGSYKQINPNGTTA